MIGVPPTQGPAQAQPSSGRQDGGMANQRAAIALTRDEADVLLRTARTMVLVSNGPDGVPDPVPMWYLVDDAGAVWMRTYAASQKVRNLERDPRRDQRKITAMSGGVE